MDIQKEVEWKSIEKIKRIFKTGRNMTLAIYNLARKENISYDEAYVRLVGIKQYET